MAETAVPSSSSSGLAAAASAHEKKHPCVLCQQRKVRCDRLYPCGNCKKASAECSSPATLPTRKRKRRFPEAELLARLRKYEHHLKGYGADIEAINREVCILLTSIHLAYVEEVLCTFDLLHVLNLQYSSPLRSPAQRI